MIYLCDRRYEHITDSSLDPGVAIGDGVEVTALAYDVGIVKNRVIRGQIKD